MIGITASPNDTGNLSLHYKARKIHSLLGIIPVGLFLMEHLTVNSLAATEHGERVFNAAVNVLRGMPYLIFIEILFIFLPIVFHGIYGVIIYLGSKSNLREYNLFRNWMYIIQRISGVYTIIFIGVHLWTLRIASIINPEMPMNFQTVAGQLTSPGMLWFYIFGVLAAVFHLANGIWNFCITWGITIGPKSQRTCAYVCAAIGLALSFMGVNALLVFIGKGLILLI